VDSISVKGLTFGDEKLEQCLVDTCFFEILFPSKNFGERETDGARSVEYGGNDRISHTSSATKHSSFLSPKMSLFTEIQKLPLCWKDIISNDGNYIIQ